jgi:hypothetical protein
MRRWLGLLVVGGGLVLFSNGGRAFASGSGGHGAPAPAQEEEASDSKTRGIELGEFRIRAYYPIEAKRSSVNFRLHAIVPAERASEFRSLLENRRHKVRDQVIVSTRLAPLADYDDSQLEDFRRRILLRLRRVVPELLIDDLYVSEFQLEVRSL